jgi:O-antigen/teichoic acid export membrane protein
MTAAVITRDIPRPPPALVRNAAALMTSTVTSGVLTFGFWVVAARWFPADTVGRVSAMAASMALLAALAQLNLVSLYARFLPRAGDRTRRLVLSGYGASAVMSIVLTAGFFLLGLSTGLVGGDPLTRLLFTSAVIASAIFFIQGSVLTALGRAMWVPAVNGLTAAVRLAMLPLLAGAGTAAAGAVLSAWAVPVVISTLAVTWWVVARGAPAHARSHAAAPPTGRREVLGFASAEYVNGMITNAVAFLPPVLVAAALGPVQGAYFYLPWLVGVSVVTLLWNVVTSFVVEASRDGTQARAHLNRMIGLVLAVVVPGGLVLTFAATPLLGLLGPDYAAHGATPLRLIGLSLPFAAIVLLYSAFSAMEKRMWRLVAVQSSGALMLFAGIWLGLPRFGIDAPAAALLGSQAVVALVLLPTLIRKYRETGTARLAPRWAMESA